MYHAASEDTQETRGRLGLPRRTILLGILLLLLLAYPALPARLNAAWNELARIIELTSDPLPASPARISDHQVEGLAQLEPQKQAEQLLQRAINHYEGAIELIEKHLAGWYGKLTLTPHFNALLGTALNSNDLRVRAAALEIYLAAYDLPKNSGTVFQLLQRIQDDSGARPWALWMLGALGNRGVESDRALQVLRDHLRDSEEETRQWAVEGLALLGRDEIIEPLLFVFLNDASLRIRERAGCSLAQSGMLARYQRMKAVPELLRHMDDPHLDPATQSWVYQALRDITGQSLGSNPAAWHAWWDERLRRQGR